jgi:anti-sigma B factor antagonist
MNFFRRKPKPASGPEGPAWTPHVRTDTATIDRIGTIAVATVTVRELGRAEGLNALTQLFRDITECQVTALVLDLQNLQFMDSMCLGCLVQSLNNAVNRGGKIAMVNGEGRLLDLFRLARLDRLFPICPDVNAALAALERAA